MEQASKFPFALQKESCRKCLERYYKAEACIDEIDSSTAEHIDQVAQWMSNSDKWGVMLMGSVGNGKTTLMNATISVIKLAYTNSKNRIGINRLCHVLNVPAKRITDLARLDVDYYPLYTTIVGIDDLGEEPTEVLSYGNSITPVIDIIEDRYSRRRLLIATTNLDEAAIAKKYGTRVADRLREMMDVITFTNHSYRK
jgi:DNA replication protein DnaC